MINPLKRVYLLKRRMAIPPLLISAAMLCAVLQSVSPAVADDPARTEQPVLQRPAARQPAAAGRDSALQLQTQTSAFDMLWPLCAVLAIVVFCVLAIRKWMPQAGRLGGSDLIKLLARHHLSGKQSLCLVRFGQRAVFVGVTNERISVLSEIADPEEVASLVAAVERGRPGSFTAMFGKFTTAETDRQTDGAREASDIEGELPVSSENLNQTGRDIRGLVQRVRTLSSESFASTEST